MRYTIEISPAMERVLNTLSVAMGGITLAEVLRRAIALLRVAQDVKEEGKELCVTKNGKIEKVLVMP